MSKSKRDTDPAFLARSELKRKHELLGSWRAVEEDLGINRGELCAVSQGKRNVTARIYRALNMPEPITLHTHKCAKCGQLHAFTRRCPGAPTKYAPHPVIRLSRLMKIMNSPYRDS